MTRRWTRRGFLGAAGTVGALPFVPWLESEAGGVGGPPKRLVVFTHTNGTNLDLWRPIGTENDFVFGEVLDPLTAYKDRMVVVDGVDNALTVGSRNKGHGAFVSLWTGRAQASGSFNPAVSNFGAASGPSIEHVVSQAIGQDDLFPAVYLGIGRLAQGNSVQSAPYYSAAEQPIPLQRNPRAAFDSVFADFQLDTEELDRLRARRQTVIDAVKSDVDRLRPALGKADHDRIDHHLQAIRDLEEQLDGSLADGCDLDSPPPQDIGTQYDDKEVGTGLQFEVAARMLACRATRVIGISFGKEGSNGGMPWIEGWSGSIHGNSHDSTPQGRQLNADRNRWLATQVKEFLDRLDAVDEGAGTLLDNTLVVWSCANSQSFVHSERNVPVVMAGGGWRWDTNRYLKFGDYRWPNPDQTSKSYDHGGKPMNMVLVSIARAMGLDIDEFGDPDVESGALPGLE